MGTQVMVTEEDTLHMVMEDTDDNLLQKFSSIKVLFLNKSVPVSIQ